MRPFFILGILSITLTGCGHHRDTSKQWENLSPNLGDSISQVDSLYGSQTRSGEEHQSNGDTILHYVKNERTIYGNGFSLIHTTTKEETFNHVIVFHDGKVIGIGKDHVQ